jgi:uncharacterized GH25 family protein
MIHRIPTISLVCSLFLGIATANAHEFWLEPNTYAPKAKEDVGILLKVGQHFSGALYPYLSDRFFKFTTEQDGDAKTVEGLDGDDDPAVKLAFPDERLAILAYHSKFFDLNYEKIAKFESFLGNTGLDEILIRHRAAGKPETNIDERYYRAAKLLLNVGGKAVGEDRFTGMPLELVAERNPYSLAAGEELPVRLLYEGKPIEGILVTAFEKSNPKTAQKRRTDKDGRAMIPLPTPGAWLLNAVHMIEPAPDDGVHWISLWASMTFERP